MEKTVLKLKYAMNESFLGLEATIWLKVQMSWIYAGEI